MQCYGGEVILLLERVTATRPTVAIFGVGHVELALARVLSICPVVLWLVDSRAPMLDEARLAPPQAARPRLKPSMRPSWTGR